VPNKLDELTYYAKLLTKLRNKKYEFYVVSRIIHLLNDTEIQFTTQQVVRKNDGRRYLIDLYFPQFQIAVEIDESHHLSNEEADRVREREIVTFTGVTFFRIKCDNNSNLASVHQKIDELINEIRLRKDTLKDNGNFKPYSYQDEFSVEKWLKVGRLELDDGAKFRTHADVLRLFGKDYTSHQRSTSPLNENEQVWFPKLYKNDDWDNSIDNDGKEINQIKVGNEMEIKEIKDSIVFAHQKDVFGNIYYSFKGVFRCEKHTENKIYYERIATEIIFSNYKMK
jgi:Protein of unknown function (DUF559).